ncbi:hypothetical protein ACFLT7_03415 [candidate division KSB1 bacterium]
MKILRRPLLLFSLVLVWTFACGKEEIPEPDINDTLQGNGRWENETQSRDSEGNKIEFSATLLFTDPSNYRLFYFTMLNQAEIEGSRHDENGAYTVTVDAVPNTGSVTSGTLVFTPVVGDPWSSTFNILEGSGFLIIDVPDLGPLEFDFFRYGWG